jgi:hypothetical protein
VNSKSTLGKKKESESNENDPSRENELERQNLIKEAKLLAEKAKKEEEAFNEFQQQREKINYFWIVEKKNLEDKKAELRNKERERQDLEEKHQVEIKVIFIYGVKLLCMNGHGYSISCEYRSTSNE